MSSSVTDVAASAPCGFTHLEAKTDIVRTCYRHTMSDIVPDLT